MNQRYTIFTLVFLFFLELPLLAQEQEQELPQFPKEELTGVNTSYIEARPLIGQDGNTLYFVRRYHPDNFRGVKDFQDIYVATRDTVSGRWSSGQSLGSKVNNKRRNAIATISPDGNEGVFFNMYKRSKEMPLVKMRKTADSWTDPRAIFIENYANVNPYSDFYLDYDSGVLFLAIESDSTLGEQDLYVSFPNGQGGYKEPINLGPEINTELSEFAPFMGADGRSLFFSSYGHGGYGGSDIYLTVRLDESWKKWSTPVNLGSSINSRQEESYFSIDNNFEYLYYTQYTPRQTDRNIVRVRLPEDFTAINGPVLVQLDSAGIQQIMLSGNYEINTEGYRRNLQGIAFEGWPSDEEPVVVATIDSNDSTSVSDITGAAVAQNSEPSTGETANPSSSAPNTSAAAGSRYAGFANVASSTLSRKAQAMYASLKEAFPDLDFLVNETSDNVEFKIVQNLEYDFNGVYVSRESLDRLRQTAMIMNKEPELSISLIGHTDNVGSPEANDRVAMQRVNNIAYYLRRRGIADSRIEVIGAGDREPLVNPDGNSDDLKRNRRVETVLEFAK
jgi:outer membrane protein OmpA-like peptidoglycan-associated protein